MISLEDYFEKQNELPNEVTRNLRLIKELDEKVIQATQRIEQLQSQNNKKEQAEIKRLCDESITLQQEKIALADKVYELVDKSVQELDDDLKRFEDNLKHTMAPDNKRRFMVMSKYQKDKRKKINQEIEQSKEIFQTGAGQSEPLYCNCQKPSFGLMVMCDNQLCQKEWFHLECMKLKDFPNENTQWYCSQECRREGRNRNQRKQQ